MNMVRKCVVISGKPGSGKTTTAFELAQNKPHVSVLSIGERLRELTKRVPLDSSTLDAFVAEELDSACQALGPSGVLVLDGVKRAAHLPVVLRTLARHSIELCMVHVRTQSLFDEVRAGAHASTRGRADDGRLLARQSRFVSDLIHASDMPMGGARNLNYSTYRLSASLSADHVRVVVHRPDATGRARLSAAAALRLAGEVRPNQHGLASDGRVARVLHNRT